jgi:hypothetical protein
MFRSPQIAGFLLVLALMPALVWAAPQKTQNPRTLGVKASAKAQADPVAQPTPPPPAPPPTPEQMPAQQPQVSYLNGQLTIISRNSTLSDILHSVARQTGASIDLPPGTGFERVAGRMGPGPARNVLAELLNGSRYDYVMIASAGNPGGLQHVILTPKAPGSDNPSPAPPVAAYQPPQPQPDQQVMPNDADIPPDVSAEEPEQAPTDEAGQPPEAPPGEPPPKPEYPRAYVPGAQPAPQPDAQQAPGVKTPEQLLQELQRMQQQQQQQQQQNPRQ